MATIDSPIGEFGDELGASCTSPLDGQPWIFQFSGLGAGITRIKITFIGSKPTNIGLAFNNYDALGESVPTPVPIPTLSKWGTKAMLLALPGTAVFVLNRKRGLASARVAEAPVRPQ